MTVARKYDYLNRLQGISATPASAAQLPLSFRYGYNRANQRDRVRLEDGSFWIYRYDSLGQVISGKKYWSDGSLVPGQQFEYGFDDIGNRTATGAGGDQLGTGLRSASYTANSLNQYSSRTVPGYAQITGNAAVGATVTVNGSATDYRRGEYFQREVSISNSGSAVNQSMTVTASGGGTSSTNSGSYFVPKTPENFSCDLDGNETRNGRWDHTWDAENRLMKLESLSGAPAGSKRRLEFDYDYLGRRIWKKVTNLDTSTEMLERKYLYDGWNLIAELDGNNNLVQAYAWGLDLSGTMQGAGGVGGLLIAAPNGSNAQFAAYDGNGNVAGYADATTGAWVARYEYGPLGEPIRVSGTEAKTNPFRWSTKYTDDESGLIYYGYRYYSPSTGRWISRDPIEEEGGVNVFGFSDNEPCAYVDVLGREAISTSGEMVVIACAERTQEIRDSMKRYCEKLKDPKTKGCLTKNTWCRWLKLKESSDGTAEEKYQKLLEKCDDLVSVTVVCRPGPHPPGKCADGDRQSEMITLWPVSPECPYKTGCTLLHEWTHLVDDVDNNARKAEVCLRGDPVSPPHPKR